jgi:hypothetical protein
LKYVLVLVILETLDFFVLSFAQCKIFIRRVDVTLASAVDLGFPNPV